MSIDSSMKLLDYINKVALEPIVLDGDEFGTPPPVEVRLNDSFFFKDGCQMCGKCCHQPFITVRDEEVESVAQVAGTDAVSFMFQYLTRDNEEGKWLFRHTNPCAFLDDDNRCRIWKGRPEICNEFPYMVSMFMSRVYLSIVNEGHDILPDLEYMDDTWPCTKIIKERIPGLIEEARIKRRSML